MIPLKSTKISLLLLFIVNIIVYGVFFYLFFSIKEKISYSNEIMAKVDKVRAEEGLREKLAISLEQSANDVQFLYDYIVKADGEIEFIKEIEILAEDLSLQSEIKSVTLEPIKDMKDVEMMKMSLDVIGKWSNLYNFLRKLEALPFEVNIYKTNIERFSEEDTRNGKLVMWLGHFEFGIVKLKTK